MAELTEDFVAASLVRSLAMMKNQAEAQHCLEREVVASWAAGSGVREGGWVEWGAEGRRVGAVISDRRGCGRFRFSVIVAAFVDFGFDH
jgi:hypothetical protein